jgi:hypothetical protein
MIPLNFTPLTFLFSPVSENLMRLPWNYKLGIFIFLYFCKHKKYNGKYEFTCN